MHKATKDKKKGSSHARHTCFDPHNAIFTSWSGHSVFSFCDVQLSFPTDATASNGAFPLAGTANSGRQMEFSWSQEFFLYYHCPFLLLILSRRGFYRIPQEFFSARLESGRFFAQFVAWSRRMLFRAYGGGSVAFLALSSFFVQYT